MQYQHLVVKFPRRRGRFDQPVKIANVLPGLLDDSRMVFVPRPLVFRDNNPRLQRLNSIERADPLTSLLRIGFGKQSMNADG